MPKQYFAESPAPLVYYIKSRIFLLQAWMPILKPAVHVGFGFSLLSLLIAFGILATTK
jgi:hypothetical protein